VPIKKEQELSQEKLPGAGDKMQFTRDTTAGHKRTQTKTKKRKTIQCQGKHGMFGVPEDLNTRGKLKKTSKRENFQNIQKKGGGRDECSPERLLTRSKTRQKRNDLKHAKGVQSMAKIGQRENRISDQGQKKPGKGRESRGGGKFHLWGGPEELKKMHCKHKKKIKKQKKTLKATRLGEGGRKHINPGENQGKVHQVVVVTRPNQSLSINSKVLISKKRKKSLVAKGT